MNWLDFFTRFAAEPPEPVLDVHPGIRQREAAVPCSAARAREVEKVGHGKELLIILAGAQSVDFTKRRHVDLNRFAPFFDKIIRYWTPPPSKSPCRCFVVSTLS